MIKTYQEAGKTRMTSQQTQQATNDTVAPAD